MNHAISRSGSPPHLLFPPSFLDAKCGAFLATVDIYCRVGVGERESDRRAGLFVGDAYAMFVHELGAAIGSLHEEDHSD